MNKQSGLSLVELMVSVGLFSIMSIAGLLLFASSQSAWTTTDAQIQLQQTLRELTQKISAELEESGEDKNNVLQVTILNNTGVNNSDILRFAVPLCVCGTSSIDTNGDVKNWGAPLNWGQAGCSSNYTVDQNNKVAICHVPPGNPNNPNNLSVNLNAVAAHLSHGDWIGDCNACSPANYNNKTIEYLLDNNNQLLRRVLDTNGAVVSSAVVGKYLTDFQTVLNQTQTMVNISAQFAKKTNLSRIITLSNNWDVFLRNK